MYKNEEIELILQKYIDNKFYFQKTYLKNSVKDVIKFRFISPYN